ncbi:Putative glycoside hydrolase, family 35, Galactose-binding-like domain superfamily [Septoria linicola]|uniref:beta-galactosidase n=1 Tax=Septoria linicola TaxID=215465 RepID=A0A9Q9B3X6_9PEZI|nr:putative glycoside hydrolase, family 35, Galactose-binding-like domain superfamily [Septoria linicola]USW58493.1 Putative glycoside hydrolase, family 35, Galactose-binding-like domain superfamily [Septoria linicola]
MKYPNPVQILASASLFLQAIAQSQWPLHNNGLNEVVQWDHYSYIVDDQRLVIFSGELHPWRIPVPELWIDILEKIKSAGFNAIALYELWGWHAPNNETLDFETGAHRYGRIFEDAKRAGLYVIYRPGPYSNAEANGGGFPGWLTTGQYGTLRNNDSRYTAAWERYSGKVADYVKPHLVTNGGNIIMWQLENEYPNQWLDPDLKIPNETAIEYMELLQQKHRSWDIDIPFAANAPNFRRKAWSKDYSNERGNTDVYGLDHYPGCWSCDLSECTSVNGSPEPYTLFDYVTHFEETALTQPWFLPEFQGGSYNPWIGPAAGCRANTGPQFVNLYYRHNLAQRVSAMNVYMAYGGTNWGNTGYPLSSTSYDYSAPVQENRLIAEKYSEFKLFGLFLRVARDFTKVDRLGNSTTYTTSPEVIATELRNPDTGGAFYVTRHDHSPSTSVTQFKLHVDTSIGKLTIPYSDHITLNGVQSKIVVTDFAIGATGKSLIYSTIEVLSLVDLGDRQVIVLWALRGESGEVLLKDSKHWTKVSGTSTIIEQPRNGSPHVGSTVLFTVEETPLVLLSDNGVELVIVDRETAYGFWAPPLNNDPLAWENSTVLVHGPYLVRGASEHNDTLAIRADWAGSTRLQVWAGQHVSRVTVNGEVYNTTRSPTGSLIADLPVAQDTIESIQASIQALDQWKVADSLPEKDCDYDDSQWTVADRQWTPNPNPPETYPVLFADEYGYQAGNLLWRGRFDASAAAVYLRVIGGAGFGFSAYLNGNLVGVYLGSHSVKDGNLTISLPQHILNNDSDNVLLVLQDTMGKDQREGALDPRGILNATLISPNGEALQFSSWKVQGNAGANQLIEPVRGTWNEGGLYAERLGWHLNGFDDSQWLSGHPKTNTKTGGVRFYRTNLPLDLPRGQDVSIAFELTTAPRAKLRAQLYVNGYQFGKIIPWFGNQIEFPVFPGILDYYGDNAIGLSIWSMGDNDSAVDVKVKVLGTHISALDLDFNSEYLRPAWVDRQRYA